MADILGSITSKATYNVNGKQTKFTHSLKDRNGKAISKGIFDSTETISGVIAIKAGGTVTINLCRALACTIKNQPQIIDLTGHRLIAVLLWVEDINGGSITMSPGDSNPYSSIPASTEVINMPVLLCGTAIGGANVEEEAQSIKFVNNNSQATSYISYVMLFNQ